MVAGAYLCNKDAVAVLCEEGPERVRELIGHGVQFDRDQQSEEGESEYHLAKEGGHSAPRILHRKDTTGVEIINKLARKALQHPRIEVLEGHLAIDILVDEKNGKPTCVGCDVLDEQDKVCSDAQCLLRTAINDFTIVDFL